ncbi:hypothetical protein LMH73_009845 [Vibrio splendidus]|nr:hypothetical protein [Vibrio splendidus]MCC4883040.1 hypothetical protein [Vibrio splendidus]
MFYELESGETIEGIIDSERKALIEQFDEFMKQDRVRNTTLLGDFTSIYMRKQQIPDRNNHLCIANIEIAYDNLRGNGLMTSLLEHIESNLGQLQGVEFECIHNVRLTAYLDGRGYVYPSFRSDYLKEIETHRYIDTESLKA